MNTLKLLKYIFFISIPLFLFCAHSSAQNTIEIDDSFTKQEVINDLFFFIDINDEYTIEDIASWEMQDAFLNSNDKTPYLGYKQLSIWVKFDIKNTTLTKRRIIIRYDNPLINYITFYNNVSPGSYKTQTSGLSTYSQEQNTNNPNIIFETELHPSEEKTVYFKLQNKGMSFSLPFTVFNHRNYIINNNLKVFVYGLFYGILIFIILINLFFYINLNHKIYLYYILYVLSFMLFLLTRDGLLKHYVWGNCIWCAEQSAFTFAELPLIFLLLFTQTALRTEFYQKKLHNLINSLIISISAFTLASFFFETPIYIFSNISVAVCIIPIVYISIISLKTKNLSLPRFFLAGIMIITIGALLMIFKNFGYITHYTGEFGLKISLIVQLTILSFGLTAMYRTILKETNKEAIENLKKLNKIKDQINIELEQKVKSRTEELDKKNTELIIANKQLGAERDIFETQRNLISQQRQETTDSIKYAQRIQRTLLPDDDKSNRLLGDHFILEIPKDIVSGDFYWIEEFEDKTIVVVADCTGHGVPGAFMSIIGITFLNEIVNFHKIGSPNKILDMLREKIIHAFTHAHDENSPKDGMDISIISLDRKNKKLEYAGAYNPLFIVRKNQLISIKADKMPISIHEKQNIPFTNNEFDLKTGDFIYMFTDGYVDQFGWRSGKKFKHNQFKELLLDINDLPPEARKVILLNTFKNWKGDLEQIDDICIVGLKS